MDLKQPNAQQTEMAKMMKEGTAEEAAREAKGPARRNLISLRFSLSTTSSMRKFWYNNVFSAQI